MDGCVFSAASTLRTGRPRSCRAADVDYAHRWTADLWSASGVTEEVAGAADSCHSLHMPSGGHSSFYWRASATS